MAECDYRKIFLEEMQDRLSQIEKGLLELEDSPFNTKAQESLFRHYHSIKGMCASMGYRKMMRFAHLQESLLSAIRDKRIRASKEVISALFSALDVLKEMTELIAQGKQTEDVDIEPMEKTIQAALSGSPPTLKAAATRSQPKPATHTTTMKVEGWLFDELLRGTAGLLTVLSELKSLSEKDEPFHLRDVLYRFEKHLKELNSHILSARLVPLSLVTDGLGRVVRDLSHQMDKKVELKIHGAETRLDKSALEALSDSLVHIIRNAVDHGIEPPDERRSKGKDPTGHITIKAAIKKDMVLIEVSDDGRGIDTARLAQKAVESGIPEERIKSMEEEELLMLLCRAGLSLKGHTTDVSGRGVGMDAVLDRVVSIGGRLSISSRRDVGTTIRLELPQRASIVRVLFVKAAGEMFALPLKDVEALVEVTPEKVDKDRLLFREDSIPARGLADILGMSYNSSSHVATDAIVIADEKGLCAVFVDGLTDEAEAYIKPLPQPVTLVEGLRGYIVGAEGQPILVIDAKHLARSILA